MKFVILLVAIFATLSATGTQIGPETVLEGEDLASAKEQLVAALVKMSAGGGPSYSIVEVSQATRQVAAGFIYRYKTVLGNDEGKRNCTVYIRHPAVGNGELIIECVNEPPVIRPL